MCFVKELLVEAFEKSEVVRIQLLALKFFDYAGDIFAIPDHSESLDGQSKTPKPKGKRLCVDFSLSHRALSLLTALA